MNLLLDSHVSLWWLDGMSHWAQRAELAPSLPPHHKDPFDRMLIAQAQLESLALVTADSAIEPYGIPLINARL